MTQTTEQKALALVNDCGGDVLVVVRNGNAWVEALCRAIEQHEAFRQEVSDAVKHCHACSDPEVWRRIKFELDRFIIPKSKPDPLVDVLDKMLRRRFLDPLPDVLADEAHWLRAELEARGLEIREKNDD